MRSSSSTLSRLFASALLLLIVVSTSSVAHASTINGLQFRDLQIERDLTPDLGFDDPPSAYPLEPVDLSQSAGIPHGYMHTTTGYLSFRVTDFELPGRIPLVMDRVYNSSVSSSLPPPPPGIQYEARWTRDLGKNWILGTSAYLIRNATMTGYFMATPSGEVIEWIEQTGGQFDLNPV